MRSFITFAALVLTTVTGCRAIPETKSDDTAGHNLEDTASQTDTAENTGETGTVDTDTAPTDTGSDTGSDTDDTATDPCAFTVPTWDGDITMQNEVAMALNPQTPSALWPHIGTFAEVDITTVHEKCPAVTITNFQFAFVGSDVDGTGWYESIEENGIYAIDRSTGEMIGTSTEGVFHPTSEGHFAWYGSFQIDFPVQPEGQGPKRTIAIGTNASNSPAATDDYVIFTITTDSLWWSDGTTEARAIHAALSTGELSIIE